MRGAVVGDDVPEEMRGVRNLGIRKLALETMAVPSLNEDELLIRVERCGICAGDAKCFHGAPMFWGDESRPPYVQIPVTPGHEFVGTLVRFGGDAARRKFAHVQLGDRVIAEQVVPCNDCLYCRKNLRWLCLPHDIFGFHSNGGFAEYMRLPTNSVVHKVPRTLSASEAVLIEPLSCSVHGVERAAVQHGDVVVVSGAGAIGLGMVAAAKAQRPARVVALDCVESRLELARRCGADVVLNPLKDDVVAVVRSMTDGYGCDVYLEATGNPASVKQGLQMVRKRARFVEFSVFKDPVTVDWTIIGDTKELDVLGAHCSGDTGYQVAMELLVSGNVPANDIVTHTLPLEQAELGIDMVSNAASSGSVKVALDPFASV